MSSGVHDILARFLHVDDGGRSEVLPASESFWEDLARGDLPQLDRGRLMSAFTFSAPWPTWERHPAGEELAMLLSGAAELVLDGEGGHRVLALRSPGGYVLVPRNVWHTARTTVATTMLFLTPGAGTEHRPVDSPSDSP